MMACNFDEFPPELSSPLLAFVALTGLDIVHNAIHRAIWDLLSNNRQADRVPIHFRVLEGDHEYPRHKTKRSTYEWYLPKGILKVNWMGKHLGKIPALVVVFFDLDWDESAWNEKLMELSAKVRVVRSSLGNRNTKVAVVLIQKNSPLPPGEDVIAAERAATLCNMCELTSKLLYVFPHSDHLFGYAIRLENAFYELSQNYYQNQTKLVKGHREYLNKTTHQLLFVRHQFKIAFYNELKHDVSNALKHYKQAYANLMEVRTTDTNIAEVKMVAGFINYKICRLSFYLNTPVDAISQFRKHIDIFKNRVGNADLVFEHSAWMAKQFSAFGDLFEESIKVGLSAIQTQHPGFYYQQAAIHAKARKKMCRRLCHNVSSPTSSTLAVTSNLEYYGQRPWRPGVQSIEPPDQAMEQDGIRALQHREATEVNHAMLVIPLLSNAIAQFKKYRCPRMKRYLVVQMGEEYYDAQDYGKALALLSHVIWDYRLERWWDLAAHILMTAVKCAYLLANVQEYVTICLEAIGPYIITEQAEKERIQLNVAAVMANKTPDPEPDLSDSSVVHEARKLWDIQLSKITGPSVFTMEMSHVASFLKCKALFMENEVTADRPVSLNVFLSFLKYGSAANMNSNGDLSIIGLKDLLTSEGTSCPLPIRFAKLCVTFSNQSYNEYCILTDAKALPHLHNGYVADLLLEPSKTKVVPFTFIPSPSDTDQLIEISSVVLQLGNEQTRCALLQWKENPEAYSGTSSLWGQMVYQPSLENEFSDIKRGHHAVRILPRESRLKITLEHEAPALVNECYPIKIVLHNQESVVIRRVTLEVGFSEKSPVVSLTIDEPLVGDLHSEMGKLDLGNILVGQQLEKVAFLNVREEGSWNVTIKVEYVAHLDINGQSLEFQCCAEEELLVPVVQPFNFILRTLSEKMETLDSLWVEEPFLLHIEVQSTSPWPLILKSSRLKLGQLKLEQFTSQVHNVMLKSSDAACECHYFDPQAVEEGLLELGSYFISWKRTSSGDSIPIAETTVALPTLVAIRIPVSVALTIPTHGWVRTPLAISYDVHNRTPQVQEFDFCMDSSDSFMYAGHKQVHFKILPQCNLVLRYNLYPLVSGNVPLPKLRMLTHDSIYDSQIEGIVQKMLPSSIFIMPQAKSWSEADAAAN